MGQMLEEDVRLRVFLMFSFILFMFFLFNFFSIMGIIAVFSWG